ncbi:MAG: hypothetical protein KI790_18930, partial [Cyclobacteriaceae bacterium]|nr:hypothetical protein [Cyclobacteriaceae bacterium HetDA_MAG_MS6]
KILKEVGIENAMIRNLQLRDYLTQNLDQVEFFKDSRSSIVRVIHSDYDKLVEKSIQVTQQGQYIRVSPNFYNIKEELEVLINP